MNRIPSKLETALFNNDRFGIRPAIGELEELVKLEYLDNDENDGWSTSIKGREYIRQYKATIDSYYKNKRK